MTVVVVVLLIVMLVLMSPTLQKLIGLMVLIGLIYLAMHWPS